jgi:hypothetical protein
MFTISSHSRRLRSERRTGAELIGQGANLQNSRPPLFDRPRKPAVSHPAAFPALNVSGMLPKQVHKQAMDCLRRAIDILYRQNDDEQTEGFRRWLYEISVEVAHAAKEGGFLGFGGQIVSEDELAALRQIAWVLGLPVVQH